MTQIPVCLLDILTQSTANHGKPETSGTEQTIRWWREWLRKQDHVSKRKKNACFSNMYSFIFHTHLRVTRDLEFGAEIRFKPSFSGKERINRQTSGKLQIHVLKALRPQKSGYWFTDHLLIWRTGLYHVERPTRVHKDLTHDWFETMGKQDEKLSWENTSSKDN